MDSGFLPLLPLLLLPVELFFFQDLIAAAQYWHDPLNSTNYAHGCCWRHDYHHDLRHLDHFDHQDLITWPWWTMRGRRRRSCTRPGCCRQSTSDSILIHFWWILTWNDFFSLRILWCSSGPRMRQWFRGRAGWTIFLSQLSIDYRHHKPRVVQQWHHL